MLGNSNNETNFPHALLLTNRQDTNLRKAFENNPSTNIKLSKTQSSKMIQSGGFRGRRLSPLLKNVIKPLAKNVLIPLGLTAVVSAADAGIHKNILGPDKQNNTTAPIISNHEMEALMKIVKSLEDSGLLLKGVS